MAGSEEEVKSLLIRVKKTKIMASGPIGTWQTDGEEVDTVAYFISCAPKLLWMVTAAMKLKDACPLKAMTSLNSILKIRAITLPTKIHIVKIMVFPIVMYGCQS